MAAIKNWIFILLTFVTSLQLPLGNGEHAGTVQKRMTRSLGDSITKKTWRVTSILSAPYLMKKSSESADASKPQFTGFIPDMLDKFSERLGVKFELYLVPDGRYGSQNSTGGWNGMIGEVIKMEKGLGGADLAAAAITVTSVREKVVNFINPFQNLGLSIVMKRAEVPADTAAYSLLTGLGYDVWIACFLGLVVVSFTLWLINKFNPYEWGGRYNMGRASEDQAQMFNLPGSFWVTFSALQWQGYERSPRSSSGKLLMAVWFLFVTITLATYTASLVANILYFNISGGKNRLDVPIKDLDHLVSQSDIQYGTVRGGSTYTYLTTTQGAEFDKIRAYFKSDEGSKNFANTLDGINKVRNSNGNFAFIMESLTAKYYANRKPCDVETVGEPFARRSYGMAVPHNIDFGTLDALHTAMLQMKEEGTIEKLEKKWWNQRGECWLQNMKERDAGKSLAMKLPRQVGLNMFWPAIILLIVGIIVSAVLGAAELVYFRFRGKFDDSNRPNDERLKEVHT